MTTSLSQPRTPPEPSNIPDGHMTIDPPYKSLFSDTLRDKISPTSSSFDPESVPGLNSFHDDGEIDGPIILSLEEK